MASDSDIRTKAISDTGFVDLQFKGTPTVLIVDDEELMRKVASLIVEHHGGKALTAIDGVDAVETFAECKDEIDCIFLDFSMPRMNGYECLLEIRKMKPDVGIVMVSGLRIIPEIDELLHKGEIEFLSKPFHEAELVKSINRLISTH